MGSWCGVGWQACPLALGRHPVPMPALQAHIQFSFTPALDNQAAINQSHSTNGTHDGTLYVWSTASRPVPAIAGARPWAAAAPGAAVARGPARSASRLSSRLPPSLLHRTERAKTVGRRACGGSSGERSSGGGRALQARGRPWPGISAPWHALRPTPGRYGSLRSTRWAACATLSSSSG